MMSETDIIKENWRGKKNVLCHFKNKRYKKTVNLVCVFLLNHAIIDGSNPSTT